MRKLMLSMLLGLSVFGGGAEAGDIAAATPEPAAAEAPAAGPLDTRLKVLAALRNNDAAALIEIIDPINGLEGFLSEGGNETEASVAAKIAEESGSGSDQELLHIWSALAAPDGVATVAAEWYPQWQGQVPQMLAGAQLGLTSIGAAVAESTSMTPLERSQLIELQWALGGWLSRTDFSDRKRFDQVLGIARAWIVASGKSHPLQLLLIRPERRLQLADSAISSFKQALALYELDVDGVLASVHMEELSRDGDRVQLRTSFKLFDVPLVFEEDLSWYEGEWQDTATVNALKTEGASASESADASWEEATAAPAEME